MPKGIKKETTEPKPQVNGKPANKLEGVQRALTEMGNEAKPLQIQGWLKDSFKIKMPISTISNYKSTILSGTGKKGRLIGHKAGKPKAASTVAGSISVQDIEAVKALVERMGAEKVKPLAVVLAK